MAATLTGSEKQISWAEQIRGNFIRQSEMLAARVSAGQISWIHPRVRGRFVILVQEISTSFAEKTTSAKAWIDHKDLGTASGVEAFFVARLKRDPEAQQALAS